MKLPTDLKQTYQGLIGDIYNSPENQIIINSLKEAGIEKDYLLEILNSHSLDNKDTEYLRKFLKISAENLKKE